MPLIGTGNVQVIGAGTWASPFYVSFTGDMAGQNLPPLTLTSTSTVANTVVTSYNADSQTATIGDNFSDYAYQYDGQGNTATVDNAGTPGVPDVVLTSVYDGMGNRKSLSASIANVKDFINNYSYDALSRLYDVIQQSQTGGNAVAPKQVYYKLDGIGDVTEVDRSTSTEIGPNPNGFANSIYSYNTLGQLTGINHESGGASVDDLTYTYDGIGRVKTFGSIDGSVTYGYDPMSELVTATYTAASGHTEPPNLSLNFDTNGNRTTVNGTSTTVAPDNHLANDGTFTFGYDGAGNLISRTRISNAAANDYQVNYTWDAANRLTDVQDLNNSDTLTEHVHYVYDMFGHLIERELDPTGGGTYTQVVHYVWDGDGMVLAFDGNGNLTTRYLNGPNTSAYDQYFATLAEEDITSPSQQGTTTWPELDAQGSVIDVASSAGAIIDHIEYNATGAVFSESNPSVSHIASFQGGYLDPATGMVKYGARWEVMADAFWASQDPIGFLSGSMNLSEAVGNSAANTSDPTGLAPPPAAATTGRVGASKAGDDGTWRYMPLDIYVAPETDETDLSNQVLMANKILAKCRIRIEANIYALSKAEHDKLTSGDGVFNEATEMDQLLTVNAKIVGTSGRWTVFYLKDFNRKGSAAYGVTFYVHKIILISEMKCLQHSQVGTLAHEIGHALGEKAHSPRPGNFLRPPQRDGITHEVLPTGEKVTVAQSKRMRQSVELNSAPTQTVVTASELLAP